METASNDAQVVTEVIIAEADENEEEVELPALTLKKGRKNSILVII